MRTAEQQRSHREAQRRREAANLLRFMAGACGYGAQQLSDGLTPEQARQAAFEAAGELAEAARALRKLARPGLAERQTTARLLASAGMATPEIAQRIGTSERTVWRYLGHP